MSSPELEELQNCLREFPCHFVWDLEHKSIKPFQSLMDLINEHIADCPAMVIEGLLFKSYLFFSDFRGNVEKKKSEAIECLNKARAHIRGIRRHQCLKDGYLSIVIALEAWLDRRNKIKLEANIEKHRELCLKYEIDSNGHNMFQGSIHATRGFALTRLGMLRYAESIEQFEKALELCPKEKDWMFSLGLIKWRISKASLSNQRRLCDDMKEAETIFYNVLKLHPSHSYALALIAKIKHRKKDYRKAEQFLKYALKPPVRKKIIGEVAQTYRQMKKFDEALKVLKTAENMPEPGSFIYHQLYLVYRDMRQDPPVNYLQKAIDTGPSNIAAKFDRAKELEKINYDRAYEYYDEILANVENGPHAVIRTCYRFALFLETRKKDEAIEKYQILLDKALSDCKANDKPLFIFLKEVDWMVRDSIEKIKNYYEMLVKANKNVNSLLRLAVLEKKLGYTRNACWRYQQILDIQPPVGADRRLEILGEVAAMKTNNGLLDDVEGIIEKMEQLRLNHSYDDDDIFHIKANLAIEKGRLALKADRDADALHLFRDAVKFGSHTGAKLLLGMLVKMNRNIKEFYIYCAEIDVCVEKSCEIEKEGLKKYLEVLLKGCPLDRVDTVLNNLEIRETQFRMERSIVQNNEQLSFRDTVIHKCRIILNQTMMSFRDRHYGHVTKSCDYFNVQKCSSADIEDRVRKKFTKDCKWDQFDQSFPDLFKFLVSIQPASNPQQNNWMLALLRMDNANKHEQALGDKLKVDVYSDEHGNMVEQEFTTIEIAREACDKIRNILEEFYKYL